MTETGATLARKRTNDAALAASGGRIDVAQDISPVSAARYSDVASAPQDEAPQDATVAAPALTGSNGKLRHPLTKVFSDVACATAHFAGRPAAFLLAAALVVIWGLSGPLFGYSDTWQLVINTSTTIVTFLMVFLIQHTQNRDTLALQLKLSELIIKLRGAEDSIATAEDLSEEELEELHKRYRHRAETTLAHLNQRRGNLKRAS